MHNIEVVKTFWDKRPCNINHSPAPLGTREYFDQVERRKYFVEPHIPSFAEFPKWRGKKVLEIGCGIGTDGINFARAGADYTAIELSPKSLQLAEKRFALFDLKGTFYEGNAEEIASIIPPQRFDLIYAFGVIHHTPQPAKVIKGVTQFMGKDSELRMMVYAKNSWKNIMIQAGYDQPEAQVSCPVVFTYTIEEVRKLLHGFEILDIHQDHIFPYVIGKYIRYEYELQPYFKAMSLEMFQALEKALGWHMLVRAKLKREITEG